MAATEEQNATRRGRDAHRRRMIAYGQWQPWVDAGPARERLIAFRDAGIGRRRVGKLTGLHPSVISGILYGQAGRQIRPETEAKILAVEPSPKLAARVDATGTHRRIQAMVASGRPLGQIGRRLGKDPKGFRRILAQPTVEASTADGVRRLYDAIGWRIAEPKTPRAQYRAAAARKMAADNGWPPASAWSADQIDRPDGVPDEGWQEWQRRPLRGPERWAAVAEDTRWLEETQGLDRRQIAKRLGMSRDDLDHFLMKARDAEAAEHEQQRERFAAAAEDSGREVLDVEAG
jgi:hypothetical protein